MVLDFGCALGLLEESMQGEMEGAEEVKAWFAMGVVEFLQ